jgi:sugar phosphate isomerase/epimerase
MRKLAFSTNAFKKCSVFDAVDQIALTGYTSVELMADTPHALPESFSESDRTRLRQQLARLHLTVSNVNAFTLFACGDTYHPTWIEEDAAMRERRIAHTRRAIELASAFDCKTVSIQPGGPLIGTSLSRTTASERFAEALSQVLPTARAHNVIVAVEPEPGLLIQSAGEYIEFKRTFFANDDFVRMNCDIGHLSASATIRLT